jgi:phage terminase large subunit-like protein
VPSSSSSLASQLAEVPNSKLKSLIASLTPEEAEIALHCWELWRRPSQAIPSGNWINWLIKAGRGFGKTRTGAETVRQWIGEGERYVNLIGATADDARDIMVEGESGILAVCPRHERPIYKAAKRCLDWPSGAHSLIFTADEPERLRGKQHGKLWCDELGSWRYPESWDQAMFGLRLGRNPQAVITTTPRPTEIIKSLVSDKNTFVTNGSTFDNKANLAGAFLTQIVKKYEGTRLGRQELYAEILDDNPGALWNRAMIDKGRVAKVPALYRIVVAIDPAVSANLDSDETGIGAAGLGENGEVYILEDASVSMASPNEWGAAAVALFDRVQADRIVAEVNQGGDLVEANIRAQRSHIPYTPVHAKRGKALRAEPVAALYEQGKVHHVGYFPKLEDQMCDWNPTAGNQKSPDRVDWLVYAVLDLLPGVALPPASGEITRIGSYRRQSVDQDLDFEDEDEYD